MSDGRKILHIEKFKIAWIAVHDFGNTQLSGNFL